MAVALVLGAGAAFASVALRELKAATLANQAEQSTRNVLLNADGSGSGTTTTTTTKPPPPKPILPFNAKLTSNDIPVATGGVRSGGCSGSLIAPQWIVSAGHCFHDGNNVPISGKPPYTTVVTIGKLNVADEGGQTAEVVDVRQSPVNDLALAKLSVPVVDVVPLALPAAAPPIGQKLQFAGWGSLSATVMTPTDRLKRGEFTVSAIDAINLEAQPVAPRTVQNSPCPQDSGAPFFITEDNYTGVLVAVESTGPDCPQPGNEVIARVDVIVDWIRQQTGNTAR
ncbi:trypsin-like serine protease [Umezawaea endophytica]|uniref:Trypsin-like serine protease n=1 Tax=Umezawaea endophytica TaxID=1654476 RepID=A0A9X3A3P7_9PSEU|nr:trypsin-like serine protease [Umezawaea endophytica]MCS7481964.1 trypsin-like serine protease [Umezawaea endophytica]